MKERKIWTYDEVMEIFPLVRELTEQYYYSVKELEKAFKETIIPENEMEKLEDEIGALKKEWVEEMYDIGAEIKGLWLVDFDHGSGYYCWKVGEKTLMYEHTYEEGFAGRKPIQTIKEEDEDDTR